MELCYRGCGAHRGHRDGGGGGDDGASTRRHLRGKSLQGEGTKERPQFSSSSLQVRVPSGKVCPN